MRITDLVQLAYGVALLRSPDLNRRWIRAMHSFRAYGAGYVPGFMTDFQADLLIWAMEDEVVTSRADKAPDGPDLTLQLMLSRHWVLSMYELLRVAKDSAAGKANPALQNLYQAFRLVRIPLAKQEIAGIRPRDAGPELFKKGDDPDTQSRPYRDSEGKPQYMVPGEVSWETGSLCWLVPDYDQRRTVAVYRRELSDAVLDVMTPDWAK